MQNILRKKYFNMVSEGQVNIRVFLECGLNWLRLIMLCENITRFWPCGPDCICDIIKKTKLTLICKTPLLLTNLVHLLALLRL